MIKDTDNLQLTQNQKRQAVSIFSSPLKVTAAQKKAPTKKIKVLTPKQLFLKATLLALGFAFILLLLTFLGVGLYAYGKFNQFAKTAGVDKSEFIHTVTTAYKSEPTHENYRKNFLVLGVDSLETRGDVPPLSDTMMLMSLNLKTGQINTLSLPRDLWSEAYKTKINALLAYGSEQTPDNPREFPEKVIEELTAIDIHHTIVLSMEELSQLIDLAGGVEVEIETSFIDSEFPRTDVAITKETDPAKLYETVAFKQGSELMNSERALKYIRSRKSEDDQGTDISRGQRQQQVIRALFNKLSNIRQFIDDPASAGELYKYYVDNFDQYLDVEELISTVAMLAPVRNQIKFKGDSLSIYPEDKNGVITNPPIWQYQGQWIYEIRDLENFKTEIKTKLYNEKK